MTDKVLANMAIILGAIAFVSGSISVILSLVRMGHLP